MTTVLMATRNGRTRRMTDAKDMLIGCGLLLVFMAGFAVALTLLVKATWWVITELWNTV